MNEVLPQSAFNKTVVFERHPESGTIAGLSSSDFDKFGPNFLSSITLPVSIIDQLGLKDEESVGLFFSFFETSVMFPIANSTDDPITNITVSPVVAATVSQTLIQGLQDSVHYSIHIDQVSSLLYFKRI